MALFLVGAAGWARRKIRRMAGKMPRIWRGTNPIHLVKWSRDADRISGFPSRSVIRSTRPSAYALFKDRDFDRVLDAEGIKQDEWAWSGLADLLWNGDIWVAFFDSLFLPPVRRRLNEWILYIVKLVGIKIIAVPHGMDVFCVSNRITRYDWVGRVQVDYPAWDLNEQSTIAVWRTALWCRVADFVVGADSTTNRFVSRHDLTFKWFPVDCNILQPAPTNPRGSRPIVIHAPQHRRIKGTESLISAIDRLKQNGVEVELQLIEKVERDKALGLYAAADIIADQFCMGAYGMFALEALALGKPVLTYLDQEHLSNPTFNLPIINANPENLERILKVLIQLPALRERIGKASREAVERYQGMEALAEVWQVIYNHVWWGEGLNVDATRHFSKQRTARSFTEDPSDPAFWPVDVTDLISDIQHVLDQDKPYRCYSPAHTQPCAAIET